MPGQQLPARINLRADRLRHAEDDAARERAPHAAEAADDDGLEAEDQPRGSDRRIEVGAHGEEDAGHRDDGERKDRKSTRLNSSHVRISYAVFCLKKKKK